MLKKSIYNVCVKKEDSYILHNTLYGGVVKLLPEEYTRIEGSRIADIQDEYDVVARLKKHGFLVDESVDEYNGYQKLTRLAVQNRLADSVFHCVIAVTTQCNARCAYCYENGILRQDMDSATVKQLLDYIKANANGREVDLTWFGGEPLIRIDLIDEIAAWLKEHNIHFVSSMVSNGLLFNDELVRRIKDDWNLTSVQISIDDSSEQYDEIKNYIENQKGAFERVMKNIGCLLENEISVALRVHIDKKNKDRIGEIVDNLSRRFRMKQNLTIYPAFVAGDNEVVSDREREELVAEVFHKVPFSSLSWYENWLMELPYLIPCMRADKNAIVVSPGGTVCRCENDVGVKSGYTIMNNLEEIPIDHVSQEQCRICAFFPKCMGGCMADRQRGFRYCSIARYVIPAVMHTY